MEGKKTMEKISTGSFDLNEWLDGGYEKGVVSMIVGPAGSGKSNFSVLAACSQARDKKVIFVDTEGGFSVERVKQIVGEDYEKILENILLLNPTSFLEQKESFVKLLKHMQNEEVGLVIVDSMAMLYRLELGDAMEDGEGDEKIKEVNRDVARQMRVLVEISRKQNIPVLITNQVYSGFLSDEEIRSGKEKEVGIVGGDLFKYWSKCIIELKHGRGRRAVLLKHRNLAKKDFDFEIRNEGIFKRKGLF